MRSEVDLPLPEVTDVEWDVDIVVGSDVHDSRELPEGLVIAEHRRPDESLWYQATRRDSTYVLRFRDCGEYRVSSDLSHVEIRSDPSGRGDLLPILMAGTVTAFLLTLRGATVIHASAVALDGVALGFVGRAGQGKSTLAAAMCASGAMLVTDDVLTVDGGPPTTCLGGGTEIRLRSVWPLLLAEPSLTLTRTTADERVAVAFGEQPLGRLRLGAVVIPCPSRTATNVGVTQLEPTTALFALLTFPRVHGWTEPEILARDFEVLSEAVNHTPVYAVTVPWGPPFNEDVARTLASLVADPSHPSDAATARR